MAFGRNLTTAEIIDQVLHFRRIEPVNHLVFMGMGEPMMNLDNVLESCELLPDIGITNRRTTVSTVGWLPGIEQFNQIDRPIRLAFSLHAADPELRSKIMPVNDRWPLDDVLAECRKHYEQTNRKVFIEYVMLDGVNDHRIHAEQLAAALVPHEAFKVNLIPYNPTGTGYGGSARTTIGAFRDTLKRAGVPATVRLTRGQDIAAACGQLVADKLQEAAVSDEDREMSPA
jgi:23S rRNA (adenine2503-C2)-methyltransferase